MTSSSLASMTPAAMQILRCVHAKMQAAALPLRHTHSASVLLQTLWIFSVWHFLPFECTPLLHGCSLPPFLPLFPSLSAVFCPASLHAWPALLWLLTSKSCLIHQSLIRERGLFRAALKEREGGRRVSVLNKRGNECMKRPHKRERGSALDRRGPEESQKLKKKKKRGAGAHSHTTHKVSV